jgi:hypothetical protein
MTNYQDLDAWKISQEIYLVTVGFPKAELYGLVSQLRRPAAGFIVEDYSNALKIERSLQVTNGLIRHYRSSNLR